MTKTHLIGIAVAAIVLLIIFGHNPSKYFEKKQMEATNRGLVNRIMKHNDPSFGKKSKTPPSRTSGVDFGADTSADKIPTDPLDSNARNGAQARANPYRMGNNNYASPAAPRITGLMPPAQAQQPQTQPQAPVGGDDYYPPTPAQAPRTGPQSQLQDLFKKPGVITTQSGIHVAFQGPRAYEIDANGVRKPLKDGKYKMSSDSNYIMTIRGGERVIF